MLGLAAALSPASLKPAAAASQSLEDLEADLIICKVNTRRRAYDMCKVLSSGVHMTYTLDIS